MKQMRVGPGTFNGVSCTERRLGDVACGLFDPFLIGVLGTLHLCVSLFACGPVGLE